MRRVREWLAAPDQLTDRQAHTLLSGCYLTGYLVALAWDAYQERRREQMQADARVEGALRSLFAQVEDLQKGGET